MKYYYARHLVNFIGTCQCGEVFTSQAEFSTHTGLVGHGVKTAYGHMPPGVYKSKCPICGQSQEFCGACADCAITKSEGYPEYLLEAY